MNCKDIHKNLIGYIENIIPGSLRADMEKHLMECKSCKKLYDNVLATYTIYDHQPQAEVNSYFYTRLEQKIKANAQISHETSSHKLIWKLQPVAASFLVVVGICAGVMIGNSFSSTNLVINNPTRTEILKAYADDYYLTDNNDDNINALINNE